MLNKILHCILVLSSAFAFTACNDFYTLLNNTRRSLDLESASCNNFLIKQHNLSEGERSASLLKTWALHLQKLDQNFELIVKEVHRNNLTEVAFKLEKLVKRIAMAHVIVPVWLADEVSRDISKINQTLDSLLTKYRKYFETRIFLPIDVSVYRRIYITYDIDHRFLDTSYECLRIFQSLGYEWNDPRCYEQAQEQCGHQMDMDCVQNEIEKNSRPVRACQDSWMLGLKEKCTSKVKVLKDEHKF